MEKSFLEELKEEIEFSSNYSQWNKYDKPQVIRYSNIDYMKKQILSTEDKFMQRDENGKFNPNNIRVITKEEKEMILNMMEENDYPLTARMYNFLLKSYLSGKLELVPQQPGRKL